MRIGGRVCWQDGGGERGLLRRLADGKWYLNTCLVFLSFQVADRMSTSPPPKQQMRKGFAAIVDSLEDTLLRRPRRRRPRRPLHLPGSGRRRPAAGVPHASRARRAPPPTTCAPSASCSWRRGTARSARRGAGAPAPACAWRRPRRASRKCCRCGGRGGGYLLRWAGGGGVEAGL